jgi:Na+/glutamate symporter
MLLILLSIWGCMPELSQDCVDMTNASSTYLGIVAGAIIGGIVSWWVYNRQKKTSNSQDYILHRIEELEENHDAILKKLADFDDKHESTLDAMKELHRKIDSLIRQDDAS